MIEVPRGKTLGGSSSINGLVYVRGHALDFEGWRQQGNVGWGWDDVLPYFKRSEDYFRGASDAHGVGGELSVIDPGVRWPILDAYKEACIAAGIPAAADYNGGDNQGVAYFEAMIRNGRRCSASQAFLHPVRARPNLAIVTQALVEGLVMTGRRVTGVHYQLMANGAAPRQRPKSFSRPAPSARRPSCKCPALVPPRCCVISGSRCATIFLEWAKISKTTGCSASSIASKTP